MAILVADIIDEAATLLNDSAHVRWSQDELISYLDDAQKAVVILRPSASRVDVAMRLAAGTRQTIPAAGYRFLRLEENLGDDGATPGAHIHLVDLDTLNRHDPEWRAAEPDTVVREYAPDAMNVRAFHVNPPVHPSTAVYVKLHYSAYPTRLRRTTDIPTYNSAFDKIGLVDIYRPALLQYVLMRANQKFTESAAAVRGERHGAMFLELMGAQGRTDVLYNPVMRERSYDDRPPRPESVTPS